MGACASCVNCVDNQTLHYGHNQRLHYGRSQSVDPTVQRLAQQVQTQMFASKVLMSHSPMMLLGKNHPLLLSQICQASRITVLDCYLQESSFGDPWGSKQLRQFLWGQLSNKQRELCEHLLHCATPHERNLRVEHDLKDGLALANSMITHSCATVPAHLVKRC